MTFMYGNDPFRFKNSTATENPAGVFLPWEEKIDVSYYAQWLQKNWTHSFYFSGIYILLTILGERIMRDRPRFNLTRPLFLWNSGLAIFSILCVIRGLP